MIFPSIPTPIKWNSNFSRSFSLACIHTTSYGYSSKSSSENRRSRHHGGHRIGSIVPRPRGQSTAPDAAAAASTSTRTRTTAAPAAARTRTRTRTTAAPGAATTRTKTRERKTAANTTCAQGPTAARSVVVLLQPQRHQGNHGEGVDARGQTARNNILRGQADTEVERGWSRQSPLPPDGRLPPDAEPGREDEARSDSLPRLADDLQPGSLRLSAGRRRQPRAVGLRGPLLDQLDAGARGQLSPLGAVRAAPPSAQRSRRRVRGAARAGLVHVAQAAAPTARRSPLRRPEDPGAISRRRGGHRARDRLDPGTDVDPRRRRRGREQQRRRLRHGTTAGLGQHRPDPGAHRGGLPSGGLRLEPRQTLNRADLWPCHLFFKRQPGEVVPSCRFAPGGFNLVPHVSRLLDVAELVQLSTSRNQRRCHEAALLEDYHRALCRALEENQREDSTPLPSLEDVLAEYEAVRVAGLYLAAMHMSLPRRWSSWSRREPVGGQQRLEHLNVYLRHHLLVFNFFLMEYNKVVFFISITPNSIFSLLLNKIVFSRREKKP
uniref:Uncharacterized protein n=1 Tax=Trichogramma kaykai TaxID=54128 RepID=A0ABD2XQM8_9HYME